MNIVYTVVSLTSKLVYMGILFLLAKLSDIETSANYINLQMLLAFSMMWGLGLFNSAPIYLAKTRLNVVVRTRIVQQLNLVSYFAVLPTLFLCYIFYESNLSSVIIAALTFVIFRLSENVRIYLETGISKTNIIKYRVLTQVLTPMLAGSVLIMFGFDAYLITTSLCLFVTVWLFCVYMSTLDLFQLKYSPIYTKRLLQRGFPIYVLWFFDFAIKNWERWYLTISGQSEDLFIYNYYLAFAQSIWFLAISYQVMIVVQINKHKNDYDSIREILRKERINLLQLTYSVSALSALTCAVSVLFLEKILVENLQVLVFLVATYIFYSLSNMYIYILNALKKNKLLLILYVCSMILISLSASILKLNDVLTITNISIIQCLASVIFFMALKKYAEREINGNSGHRNLQRV